MNLHFAQHHGMCFGVRDALRATHAAAMREPVTMLGQLVHNLVVDAHLKRLGVSVGNLEQMDSALTSRVVITAHGSSDNHRAAWRAAGHEITDTTCPLVRKAHMALSTLVKEDYHPVVIGQKEHVEVRGLIGDFPQASVLLNADEISSLPSHAWHVASVVCRVGHAFNGDLGALSQAASRASQNGARIRLDCGSNRACRCECSRPRG